MTEWPELAAGLADQLAALPAGAVLIIAEAEGPRYAQFKQFDDRLYAEVVGDSWLDPGKQAGAPGARRLVDAGWQAPGGEHTNWWIDRPWPLSPAQYRELVAMVFTALRDVFAIAEPADLVYEAWNTEAGDADLDLPGLGLRRPA
ncbi:hypothetical protein HGA13_29330 [Nocardia speluncae]|uniref:TY-Chap N-terminal domain-containing protein n=1 Tax=Nocardia speluncae TaxID=419477 RepID=A0A846XMB4_9NOCA|nr:hypothetical protein [Nocardia speluncae]NKY37142.1 hypothetical protein [Nocardia speluncae]